MSFPSQTATGTYTINFADAMADTNYAVIGIASGTNASQVASLTSEFLTERLTDTNEGVQWNPRSLAILRTQYHDAWWTG